MLVLEDLKKEACLEEDPEFRDVLESNRAKNWWTKM